MTRASGQELLKHFHDLVTIEIKSLTYCGLWQINRKNSTFLRCAYFVFKLSMLATMYILAITVFVDIYANVDNIPIVTDGGCIFAGILVVIFKAMNYQFRRKRIERLLRKVLKCAEDLCDFADVPHVRDIINGYHLHLKVVFYGFSVVGFFLVIALLCCSPMDTGLPIRAKYPFDTKTSPWQKIGFAIEAVAISGGVMAIVSMDGITVAICLLIILQFEVLGETFENCGAERDKCVSAIERNAKGTSSDFVYRYKTCLRFHQRLISIFNDCNETYNWGMFVQMLSSTSIICLTGFQAVVVGGQSSDVIKFGIYLSAAVSQLMYVCWLGNELSYSSSILDRSQWLSNWHREHLPDIVQLFTLSTTLTRRSIKLTAGAFYALSLETFVAIIRRSYSVFALLNNMHTENS